MRAVVVTLKDLITQIKSDQNTQLKVNEPIAINVFTVTDNPDQSTTELNGDFLHSLLLIDALLRLKPAETNKQQLISYCYDQCKGDAAEITKIKEFESKYSADNAIWWYTKDTVLYKKLNEALRVQNIDVLLHFRFFIFDIYEQLKQKQYQAQIRVYRYQLMSMIELQKLQESRGKFISINSFFSSSQRRDRAIEFRDSTTIPDNLGGVLFVIDADPNVGTTKPFADISSLSEYQAEAEVLFMIASIFKLTSIHQEKNQMWTIEMTLCGDDVVNVKNLYEHTKKEYWGNDNEIDQLSFGEVLYHMGKYDSAAKVYFPLLKELPSNDPSLSKLYYYLGMIAYKEEAYDSSLTWYHKSLEIVLKARPFNYINTGELYNCIGEVYRRKNDYKHALEWHNKGIECFKEAHAEDHQTMGILYNNIALIYQEQENYVDALDYYKKSFAINEKYLPPDHADMARFHHNISIVYGYLDQYDLAMKHNNQSLEIKLKAFPSFHSSIGDSYQCIGCLHYDKSEWKQALEYFEKAAAVYQHSFAPGHPKMNRIQNNIERVKSKLK